MNDALNERPLWYRVARSIGPPWLRRALKGGAARLLRLFGLRSPTVFTGHAPPARRRRSGIVLSPAKQRLLGEFSRELDRVERRAAMRGGYERIAPYVVERVEGGRRFEFICYHKESMDWFDTESADISMTLMQRHGFVKPGDVVFDIGCNSGYFSVWYGLMVGAAGKVVAFDPYPWNALATRYNARLNDLGNVEVHEVGLSDTAFDLALPLDHARTIDGLSSRSVRARVADIREYADEHPTFLKIDIEGGEYELSRADLRGLPHVERIFLELHPFFIEDRGLETAAVLRNYARQGFDLHYADPSDRAVAAATAPVHPGMWFLARRGTATDAPGGTAIR